MLRCGLVTGRGVRSTEFEPSGVAPAHKVQQRLALQRTFRRTRFSSLPEGRRRAHSTSTNARVFDERCERRIGAWRFSSDLRRNHFTAVLPSWVRGHRDLLQGKKPARSRLTRSRTPHGALVRPRRGFRARGVVAASPRAFRSIRLAMTLTSEFAHSLEAKATQITVVEVELGGRTRMRHAASWNDHGRCREQRSR
jgi:hypothetical protein